MRSVFNDEKKLSMAALSQTLPDRLMLHVMPLSAIRRWNWSLASALAAAIGVMHERIRLATAPDRHHQSIRDQLSRHASTHRPADDTPGEQVDHSRDIQ